jgi:phage baseplate assembly protein V
MSDAGSKPGAYRRGIVEQVDRATHRVTVKFPDRDDMESHWLDVLVRATKADKDYGLPEKGEFVAVLMDERDEAGCVLGALYSDEDKPTTSAADVRRFEWADGAYVEYDRAAHVLRIQVPVGGQIELAGAAEPVALADKVLAELQAIADTFSSHQHVAGTLASPSGPVTGVTGAPAGASYAPSSVGSQQVKSA